MMKLEVSPGNYTGKFYLAMPISDTIHLLKKGDPSMGKVSKVEIIYSQTEPLEKDIILRLADEGIVLRFEPIEQRLTRIEIHDVSKVELSYRGVVFSGSVDASCNKIYNVFGPTYGGKMVKNIYHLQYPGIEFQFPIPELYVKQYQKDNAIPIEFPNGTTPTATQITVQQHENMIKQPTNENSLEYFTEVKVDVPNGITIAGRHIHYYMSPQDVLMEVGRPDKIYYKRHDKLSIHANALPSPQSPDDCSTDVDYFYNYFSLGIDVMFNGKSNVVEKIILHTNIPGSRDFNIYVKCNFKLDARQLMTNNDDVDEPMWITPDLKYDDIEKYLPGEAAPKPLVNDNTMANNPFGGTLFYAYKGAIFEVLRHNNYLNSITLFAHQ